MGARPLPSNLAAGEDDTLIVERDYDHGGLRRRRGVRRCRKCHDNYKPARAHHDSVTGRCIVKMDHFCPWVGNAIGIRNHKFFILFIFYTFLTSIISLTLILIRVIRCQYYLPTIPHPVNSTAITSNYLDDGVIVYYESSSNFVDNRYSSATTALSSPSLHLGCNSNHLPILAILSIITILFFLFTFCMLLEQSEAISTNMSKIARMKTRGGLVSHPNEYAPVATEFNEIFGGEHPTMSWHWILPLPVRFPEWAMDNIMGYEETNSGNHDEGVGVGPYREPSETDGEHSSVDSMASGISSSMGDGDGVSGGVGGIGLVGGTDDFKEGKSIVQHKSMLLEDEEDISPPSKMSAEGGGMGVVKKRSTSGPPV